MLGRGVLIPVSCGLLGTIIGLGCFTFVYAKGASYLGTDSAACANCHVMNEQYDGWLKSSHRSVAGCGDCHMPHSFFPKYATKAIDGFKHSLAFTLQNFKEPIQITEWDRGILENTCRSCHAEMVSAIDPAGKHGDNSVQCTSCHRSVGHMHND